MFTGGRGMGDEPEGGKRQGIRKMEKSEMIRVQNGTVEMKRSERNAPFLGFYLGNHYRCQRRTEALMRKVENAKNFSDSCDIFLLLNEMFPQFFILALKIVLCDQSRQRRKPSFLINPCNTFYLVSPEFFFKIVSSWKSQCIRLKSKQSLNNNNKKKGSDWMYVEFRAATTNR